MINNTSSDSDGRKCLYCGGDKTYHAVTKEETVYLNWNINLFKG
jgi:hypothetical protein